jgi:hypothetical protein
MSTMSEIGVLTFSCDEFLAANVTKVCINDRACWFSSAKWPKTRMHVSE